MKLLKDYRLLFLLLIVPYLFVLNLPYVGEEANWVIPSFEMSYFKEYVLQTIYKVPYYRPPLFNYPTIVFSKLFGWEYAKAIQRLQTITMTILTALSIRYVLKRVYKDEKLGWFGALIYLSLGDVMIHDGWLGYEDGVYIGFSSMSMLFTMLGVYEESYMFIFFGSALATGGFLTKALTSFVYFYATLIISFYILKPKKLNIYKTAFISSIVPLFFLILWYGFAPKSSVSEHGMLWDIINKFRFKGIIPYLKQFFGYPVQFWLNMSLNSLVFLYLAFKRKVDLDILKTDKFLLNAWIVGIVNFIPYWLPPFSGIRYAAPLYSIFAICFSVMLYPKFKDLMLKFIYFAIVFKFVALGIAFPIYYGHIRENTNKIAREVYNLTIKKGIPLYCDDDGWVGFSVIANIDVKIHKPILYPPKDLTYGCVFTANLSKYKDFKIVRNYQNSDYLVCKF